MNLQVVAEKAGVSVATVSRVVNNRTGVSEDKVKRIRAAIKELGFVPKTRIPRSVPSVAPDGVKYGNVLILVVGSGHLSATELFVRQLEPICFGLSEKGFSPVVCMGATSLSEMPPVAQKRLIDGVVLFGEVDQEFLDFFDGIPLLWMTSHQEGSNAFVLPGNREIGQLGAEYCRNQNCRFVVAVSSVLGAKVYESRHRTFVEAAESFGLECSLLLGSEADSIENSVSAVIEEEIDLIKKADAIFFPSDRITAFAYPALCRAGIFKKSKVPVVISCGGEKNYLSGLDPRPVSIDMGAELIGQQAVEQIVWRMRHPTQKRQFSVVIHPELTE